MPRQRQQRNSKGAKRGTYDMKRSSQIRDGWGLFLALVGIAFLGTPSEPALAQTICGGWDLVESGSSGRGAGLTGVAALTPNNVWALGGHYLMHWNGSVWADFALPDADPEELGFDLRAIGSIEENGQMWTAGIISSGQGYPYYSNVLLLRWDGNEWDRVDTVVLSPQTVWPFNPRSGSPADIDGVSENDVWAVGIATGNGDGGSSPCLALHWDGSDWTEVNVPPTSGDQQFEAVAAIATDDVWAVGYGDGGPGGRKALTFHWDGSEWSHVQNPAESLLWTFLYDVVAVASDDVWAAGEVLGETLFMHWNGSSWTVVESPGTEVIYGLAAVASDDVWAVGWPDSYYYHWDGVSWAQVEGPEVPGGTSINLTGGLAAAGPCDVWGVGGYFIGNVNQALTEHLQSGVSSVSSTSSRRAVVDVSPNPIVGNARIRFEMGDETLQSASIYNARGQTIRSLTASAPSRNEGFVTWDGLDSRSRPVPGGVYYLRIQSDKGHEITRTLTVVR